MPPDAIVNNPSVSVNLGTGNGVTAVQLLLQNFINFAFGIVGLVFLLMLIRGGYEYITAGGDKEAIQKATRHLTTAFVGSVIILSIFAIMRVVEILFGINLRAPEIPVI